MACSMVPSAHSSKTHLDTEGTLTSGDGSVVPKIKLLTVRVLGSRGTQAYG